MSSIETPRFLQSFDDFNAHLTEHFEDISNVEKGDRFASFVAKLIPFVPELSEFGQANLSEKKSHDHGVDLFSEPLEDGRQLYAQSRLKIRSKDDVNEIITKFEAYEHQISTSLGQTSLFSQFDSKSLPIFAIFTNAKISGILARYQSSHLASLKYYRVLHDHSRLHIIDGEKIFQILNNAYGKTYGIPKEICIRGKGKWLSHEKVWLGFAEATEIVSLYRHHGDALFFENIRDYLGPKSGKIAPDQITVNEEILMTVENEPSKFLERNNGITFKASSVRASESGLVLSEGSIVNGCQTTITLVGAGAPIDDCTVQVKVVESADAWDVAKSSNLQNTIDKIELDLAKFLRPQVVRMFASGAGVEISRPYANAVTLLGEFYDSKVEYDEVRFLYIGLMSNTPNNIGDQLYTKIRPDLVAGFQETPSIQRELIETLLKIAVSTRNAISQCEALFKDESYMAPFVRVFNERPNYPQFSSGDHDPVRPWFRLQPGPHQALGHGIELVATIEAPSEAGEVALGVFLADVVVGAGECGLELPRVVLTQLNDGHCAAFFPLPVVIGK